MLAFGRVSQRVRRPERSAPTAQEQLWRVAVSGVVLVHVEAVVVHCQVHLSVAVEVIRNRDRGARLNRPFNQLRGVSEASVLLTGEHAQCRLCESVLGCRTDVVLMLPPGEDVVATVAVEIHDRDHEIEPTEPGLRDDA